VQRRAFANEDALRTLQSAERGGEVTGHLRPVARLCEGTVHWTVGDATRATTQFAQSRRLGEDAADAEVVLAASIGLAAAPGSPIGATPDLCSTSWSGEPLL